MEVVGSPRDESELLYFPITELLLLTGLRYGEAAALRWPAVEWPDQGRAGRVHIRHAVTRFDQAEAPTKTGAEWSLPLRPPLGDLLARQGAAIATAGGNEGLVFPNTAGNPIYYSNWLNRGWVRVLERAEVRPRNGDAQKALRRTYVTSSLVCGRNAKAVAADLGHATARMVTEVYDSFLDPASWPDEAERARLIGIYGWRDVESRAPQVHPEVHGQPGELGAGVDVPDLPRELWRARHDSNVRPPGPQYRTKPKNDA